MRAPSVNQMRFFRSSALASAEKFILAPSCSAADAMCFPQAPPQSPLNGVPGQRPQPHFFAGFSSFLALAGFSSAFASALAGLASALAGLASAFGALASLTSGLDFNASSL